MASSNVLISSSKPSARGSYGGVAFLFISFYMVLNQAARNSWLPLLHNFCAIASEKSSKILYPTADL